MTTEPNKVHRAFGVLPTEFEAKSLGHRGSLEPVRGVLASKCLCINSKPLRQSVSNSTNIHD